ncbi:hypothetical protein P7K49_009710 [Saguinus oedipus]|uniref:Regulation of nuclear pre-mRNA domain-containing protein n=1 Tax=Saguinus oedipus TaxID=9490 RepID=A0ABQ9VKQ4_SAGOE|nr:hypothetical protein P7K49_009710 [Saguinus oedipus]
MVHTDTEDWEVVRNTSAQGLVLQDLELCSEGPAVELVGCCASLSQRSGFMKAGLSEEKSGGVLGAPGEYKQKLARVTQVRKELKSHIQSLPDLSLLPNVTGGLAPLPSAGDLFSTD